MNGEKLALADAGGHVGSLAVGYVSLDDSSQARNAWDPTVTEGNARTAARNPTTIAYLGDFDSGATAVSLPILNAAGILQVSPGSPYVGLTSALAAGPGEPQRFYPTGKQTFGRLDPGDPIQGEAQLALLHRLGVHSLYVIADQYPLDAALAHIVASDARYSKIKIKGSEALTLGAGPELGKIAARIAGSGAQAIFISASASDGAALLLRQLHVLAPRLKLLASSSLSNPTFTSNLGSAESATFVATSALPLSYYPASDRRVLAEYRHTFAGVPSVYALYGYESMGAVLASIRAAHARGEKRAAVVERFLATHARKSVLGVYTIEANGETNLSRYAIDRVARGLPVFWRVFNVPVSR